MPRRLFRQPLSLNEASLMSIAKHFESYWCAGKANTLLDYRSLSKCLETFEYLNDDTIQSILRILSTKGLLQRHHYQFLLSSNIRRLDLEFMSSADHFSVIQTIGTRCQKLTHLSISGLRSVDDDVLCKLVANLPQLVSLNLSETRTNHKVLKVVAENCPHLLELNIDGCISERGPDYDIQVFSNLSKQLGVPQLIEMFFFFTQVSVTTTVALLTSQRNLKTLGGYRQLDYAFDQMYGEQFQQTKEVSPDWICHLSKLRINGSESLSTTLSESLRLQLTFRCCPFVTDLRIEYLTDHTSLRHVSQLRHLEVFHVKVGWDLTIDFRNDIFPILVELGENFKSVLFYNISDVSVIAIGKLCPNLEGLVLQLGQAIRGQNLVCEHHEACFKKLTDLHLDESVSGCAISEKDFLNILVNASDLEHMSIRGHNLTDTVISKSAEKHGFRHLETASFLTCDSISVETGRILLSCDNPLRILEFCNSNINRKEKDQLNQDVQRMELNLQLSWSP